MVKTSITALLLVLGSAIISVAAQRCGPQGGNAICAAGNCCSQYGWCDTDAPHCDPANCLPAFSGPGSSCTNKVTTTLVTKTTTTSTAVTTVTQGGGQFVTTVPSIDYCGAGSGGVSCPGAGVGGFFYRCCSKNGHCGPKNSEQTQSDYCGAGCQPGYGSCDPGRTVPPIPAPPKGVANAGDHCGPIVNKACTGGLCCSGSNYCGTGTDFCGAANFCQTAWGTCHR